ncbi:MAG: hypothetical protein KAY37_02375 [Phycisphaerae bacterium]|nr:hypothetical protein [Phycisphaerae bacterium]
MKRLCGFRVIPLVLAAVLLAGGGPALGDPYFQIWSMPDWEDALGTGHVVPLMPDEWDSYWQEWQMYTEEGDPYPDTLFIEPVLYPYVGPEVPPGPEDAGGLVMAWGDESLPDGQYASAWKYDYLVDPDLSNAIITLTVYPPQFGPNSGITQISFGIQDINNNTRSWYWNVGPTGTIPWGVPTQVTINTSQTGVNATTPTADAYMNNPAFNIVNSQYFVADENGLIVGGQVPIPPGGMLPAVWNYWYNIVVQPGGGGDYLFEFSLDIGSDTELSDPFMDGDEAFDPGDVYWWQSAPVVPPGRDGFKDDMFIFGHDPWPDPPDATLATRVPVGFGSIEDYWEYFDLDGHDQTDFSLIEAQFPLPAFPSACIYDPAYLMISLDDDKAPGWPAYDVPVTAPSPAGLIYGTTGGRDEIVGVNVALQPTPPPYPIMMIYPIADEVTVHQSLVPNPDNGDEDDVDVDSLDIVAHEDQCPYWFFSPDHEAHLGLDPGGIYEVTGFGPVQVIDEFFHLGISEDADIDAFEFTWLEIDGAPSMVMLALLFSVDEDDPLTMWDESGGMDPTMIYVSWMTGFSMPFADPLWDDIDALTIWYRPLEEEYGACCYGSTGTDCIVTTEYDCVNNLFGDWKGPGTDCADLNGNGIADICEEVEACCWPDGSCTMELPDECTAQGGWPQGPGTLCTLEEACCLADGDCVMADPLCCDELGGVSAGAGSLCAGYTVACCFMDGSCLDADAECCDVLGGWPSPTGEPFCLGDLNGNGIDDACEELEELDFGDAPDPTYPTLLANNGARHVIVAIIPGVFLGASVDSEPDGQPDPNALGDDNDGNDDEDGVLFTMPLIPGAVAGVDVTANTAGQLDAWIDFNADGSWAELGDQIFNNVALAPGTTTLTFLVPITATPNTATFARFRFSTAGGLSFDGQAEDGEVEDYQVYIEEGLVDYLFEFSLDIGSDHELSDPFADGDEAFDPGDVYWWQSAPVVPPGRDGFKDDEFIFGQDPWPDPPDPFVPPATRVPVGEGSIEDYGEYFDLDGHDQIDVSFHEVQWIPQDHAVLDPIPQFPSECIHGAAYLMVSYDDDMAPGWPVNDVPVTAPSPAGVSSYGSTAGQDEIAGVTVGLVSGMVPPYPVAVRYPIADEITVHQSLALNPDGVEEEDDDVDSLDIVLSRNHCPFWYFTADHEAFLGLDPGGIYEVTPLGPTQVIDEFIHLGISEDADIDAFEFTWLEDPTQPGQPVLALLFSVDEDDPLTLMVDESGGLDPRTIYASFLTGYSVAALEPLPDDVDAMTLWREPLGPSCPGDSNCDGVINWRDIDYFVAAMNDNYAAWAAMFLPGVPTCPFSNNDVNGDGTVNWRDIDPFVALMNTTCP